MTKYRHTGHNWDMSDSNREEAKTCPVSGKRMYPNELEANATAKHRMGDRDATPAQLRTYKCLYCGSWHLTSKGP